MHLEVSEYVFKTFHDWHRPVHYDLKVLEIGACNINGSVRNIIQPFAGEYVGIDMQAGPDVDLVADGSTYWKPDYFDLVVCCEVFEHTDNWKNIIKQSYINLKNSGMFLATMAGEGRPFHSGVDGMKLRDGEHYANIGAVELNNSLWMFSKGREVNISGVDLRCWAIK